MSFLGDSVSVVFSSPVTSDDPPQDEACLIDEAIAEADRLNKTSISDISVRGEEKANEGESKCRLGKRDTSDVFKEDQSQDTGLEQLQGLRKG